MIWKSSSAPRALDVDVAEFVEAEQVGAAVAADDADRTRSSAASMSSLTSWAVVA